MTEKERIERIKAFPKMDEFDRARAKYETQKANRQRYFDKKEKRQ